jgi:general secretion pathway protein G
VVSAILGILVAMAVSTLRNAVNRARQKRTMADMRSLALGIESYSTDANRYPPSAGFALPSGLTLPTATVGTLLPTLSPTYLRSVPLHDGWNSWFTYGVGDSGANYILRSNGADGLPESSPGYGMTTSFNADIILVDGGFVQYPDGIQK